MTERILITGGEGVVGSYCDFGTKLGHDEFDITNLESCRAACKKYQPKVVIHLAAATDLVRCEKEPQFAYATNAVGTYHMALAAREVGARFIYVSTSGVFDGTKAEPYEEADTPNPVNVYGHSKYLGELAALGALTDTLVVRIAWVFGGGKDKDVKFVGKILAQRDATEVKAVSDRRGSPSFAKDVAHALRTLAQEKRSGIVHLSGGVATREELARAALSLVGSSAKVTGVHAANFGSTYVSGENESMPLSPLMRPWKEALKEYVETEWQ
jgi:dTDP-4-dehydrorhamnose reductase